MTPQPGQLALEQALRTRLLTFVAADGSPTLAAQLTDIWIDEAPDDAVAPYGVLHVHVLDNADPGDGGFRRQGTVVLDLYGRNSAQRQALKSCSDVAQEALWKWVDDSTGPLVLTDSGVQWRPPDPNAADRELIIAYVGAEFYWYPDSLSQYGQTAA
ncbi:MAG TPA: hypothetical protein VN607_08565 [Gemmatimonadaceae bacterium]|nr:hypothetical protein [Gemmatimonadaceae bacterium]